MGRKVSQKDPHSASGQSAFGWRCPLRSVPPRDGALLGGLPSVEALWARRPRDWGRDGQQALRAGQCRGDAFHERGSNWAGPNEELWERAR